MNKALAKARQNMRNQKGTVAAGYDNTPFPLGDYVCEVRVSEISEKKIDDEPVAFHRIGLVVAKGDEKDRWMWPYSPRFDRKEDIQQSASIVQRVLGDVFPTETASDGTQLIDLGTFLGMVEKLADDMVGELVEVTVKNRRPKKDGSHLKDDGTPWQNIFINRGLGDDAKAVKGKKGAKESKRTVHQQEDNLDLTPRAAKKKVVKKRR